MWPIVSKPEVALSCEEANLENTGSCMCVESAKERCEDEVFSDFGVFVRQKHGCTEAD